MLVLLSPAKTFTNHLVSGQKLPPYINKTNDLVKILKAYNQANLKSLMKISDQLASLVYHYYQDFDFKYAAVYLYGGYAYRALNPISIDKNKLTNLYILSPLYGIINAFDSISFYRLDLADKILTSSLLNYWYQPINNYLKDLDANLIINLSSAEFSRLLDLDNPKLITINFGIIKANNLTQPSMLIKKMRGLMARYLLINEISDLNQIKKINLEGFKYNETYSNSSLLFFTYYST